MVSRTFHLHERAGTKQRSHLGVSKRRRKEQQNKGGWPSYGFVQKQVKESGRFRDINFLKRAPVIRIRGIWLNPPSILTPNMLRIDGLHKIYIPGKSPSAARFVTLRIPSLLRTPPDAPPKVFFTASLLSLLQPCHHVGHILVRRENGVPDLDDLAAFLHGQGDSAADLLALPLEGG